MKEAEISNGDLAHRLQALLTKIAEAASHSNSQRGLVTLIAASKTVDDERLQQAIDLGQRVFGENRVQEGRQKWPELLQANPGIELHLIGPLQSNKVRDAVAIFDVIQSVDRHSLAQAIARERDKQGRTPKIYVQVNTGGEPQKSGVSLKDTDALIRLCRDEFALTVQGLMCIPPATGDPSDNFDRLRCLAKDQGLPFLSMGMSGDFVKAIEHGATHVRIGSALFGVRAPLQS